jgi:cytochrome c biogenesis protein
MSVSEETITGAKVNSPVKTRAREPLLSRFLKLLGSVSFGVLLLILTVFFCLIGMLIMQQNIEGFDRYYAGLSPWQRTLFYRLDFFNIYHSWYFNSLLCLLSLNIILASLERFPKTWAVVSRPKLFVPVRWLREQKQNDFLILHCNKAEVANKIALALKKAGWRKIVNGEREKRFFVFAESGAWNRLGAYAVHVSLLTILLGGFLTSQLAHTGQMILTPGQISNQVFETIFDTDRTKQISKPLPFSVACIDIQQKLIKPDGSLDAGNTLDWITRLKITDETGIREAIVQTNSPFDYRGYRFFQAGATSITSARKIVVRISSENGAPAQDVTIQRNGAITLADKTNIRFVDFRGNFSLSSEMTKANSLNYPNPAAVLQITPPEGTPQTAHAFSFPQANRAIPSKSVAGYTFQLIDFEKVAEQHILSVQRDPGANVVYLGFGLLSLTLAAVFFFSHQSVWAVAEETAENQFQIVIAGNTNRNENAFEARFSSFVNDLRL